MTITAYDYITDANLSPPASVQWRLVPVMQRFQSVFTGQSQSVLLSGTHWQATIKYENLDKNEIRKLFALLAQLDGQSGKVYLWDHSNPTSRGEVTTGSHTPVVFNHSGDSNTGSTLWTKGWGSAETALFKNGDYISYSYQASGDDSILKGMHIITGGYVIEANGEIGAVTDDVNSYSTTASNNKNSYVSSSYRWVLSDNGNSEYYVELAAGGDPSISDPDRVFIDSSPATEGTLGSLSNGEWDYGDDAADSLGFNTIYVKLAGGDPDDAGSTIQASYDTTDIFAVFRVKPAIRRTIASGQAIEYDKPKALMMLDDDQQPGPEIKGTRDGSIEFAMVEFIKNNT